MYRSTAKRLSAKKRCFFYAGFRKLMVIEKKINYFVFKTIIYFRFWLHGTCKPNEQEKRASEPLSEAQVFFFVVFRVFCKM